MGRDERTAARIQSVADAREFAQRRLPRGLYQRYESGTGSNVTARLNVEAFEEVMFRPRVAVFNPRRELARTVLGHRLELPLILSSVGFLSVGHRDGEAGVARAAGDAGVIQFVSGATSTPIEAITAAAKGPVFYQLYYFGGRDASAAIIERVKRAGVAGLVLTMDTAAMPVPRERPYGERGMLPTGAGNLRELLRFLPDALARPAWLVDHLRQGLPEPRLAMGLGADGKPVQLFEGIGEFYKQTPAWEDIAWIRRRWDGPIVVKGVLTVEDAQRAVAEGADAIVVSNHGGNVLDGAVPSLKALPHVADAVGGRVEVLFDSGIRRGADVVKALALGARAVLLGRAYVYPLLAAGEPGVRRILDLFREHIDATLALLGAGSVDDLDRSYVETAPGRGWPAA